MFVPHDKNVGKKPFQKPNILRRKPKASSSRLKKVNESPEAESIVSTSIETQPDSLEIIRFDSTSSLANINQTVWKLTLSNSCEDKDIIQPETDIDANAKSDTSIYKNIKLSESVDQTVNQSPLNIESFIKTGGGDVGNQDLPLSVAVSSVLPENNLNQTRTKWCLDIPSNMNIIIDNFNEPQVVDLEQQTKLNTAILVPSAGAVDIPEQPDYVQQISIAPAQAISVGGISSRAIKLKCDYPNCNKGFWNAEKLEKHKNSHNRPIVRSASAQIYSCPVKKVSEQGTEERCPRTFQVRADLLKHLNEDHTLEDAQYRCSVCGRRFFWASGLRAHGASSCARGGLVCSWPGCGRVFRLPCRLREHARAHTGDRPYLCQYPDCGWAFRSASKLVRHARRHTGERRHACAACGRAFLRREHLRDHANRHHATHKRDPHPCTYPGCEQSFTNMSTLYMHMKKVHRKVEEKTVAPDAVKQEQPSTVPEDTDNIYLVSLVSSEVPCGSPVEAGGVGGVGGVGEVWSGEEGGVWSARAARTHCTWPLPRTTHYELDDDGQTERGEGSASDVYTVNSDLFLHGNTIDEDSQHISSATSDAGLGYIDAHPTIDLMQEDLMYEDAADESSFRVLLMTGEELT